MSSFTFKQFLNEKMGIISRVSQTSDVFEISKISNSFINEIIKHPAKSYTTYESIAYTPIKIEYKPTLLSNTEAEVIDNEIIYIYKQITEENSLYIKYLLIHELVHVLQDIHKNSRDEYSVYDTIKYRLRTQFNKEIHKQKLSTYFTYLIYREDIDEISAWGNNAYIEAYLYKLKNPHKTNQSIVKYVLNKVEMNKVRLYNTIREIHHNDVVYTIIICILIGHFYELTHDYSGQQYFDKSVFELDVVKRMRKDIIPILNNANVDKIWKGIMKMAESHWEELQEVKPIIVSSFIKHMKYWYDKAIKQMGKTILLGIEDATEKIKID